ncbi:MAG: ABC transporter permease [Bacteroidales bacterium]|nr:ABC transporter permease [Bacteroidales bacterium]MCF8333173.1 ABC transporter permease [Bacteroidales bacterium]
MKAIVRYINNTGFYFINELKRIIKDPGAVLIMIIALVAYPLIYSIAYSNEVLTDIPIAVVDLDKSSTSRQFSQMANATQELQVTHEPPDMQKAKKLFFDEKVKGIVLVERDFSTHIQGKEKAHISIYCDATYFLYYKQVLKGAIKSAKSLSAGVEIKQRMADGQAEKQAMRNREPLPLKTPQLHNPYGGYGSFVMPGIIIVILQQTLLVGLGMMGGTTNENKNRFLKLPDSLSFGSIVSYLSGRAGAYLLVYLFNGIFTLVWINEWFGFPNRISFTEILPLYIPFILAVIFMGMALSTLFRKREHAFLFIVFTSPIALFISGISWPVKAIPSTLYGLGHILPSNFMVPAYLRMRTMGAALGDVTFEMNGIFILLAMYFVIAVWATRIQAAKLKS